MAEHRVAKRYAKSLIDLAVAQDQLEAIRKDVLRILLTLDVSRELLVMYQSPIINSGKKASITTDVFTSSLSSTAVDFLHLLIHKKREGIVQDICHAFIDLYNELVGISRVQVTSALPLDEATRNSLVQQLEQQTGHKVDLQTQVDPAILGGLVIRFDNRLYDASIQSKLRKIKHELTQAS